MAATTNTQTNPNSLALTPAQIMALPAGQQQQYIAGLSPQMQAIYQTEVQNINNMDFMRNSIEEYVYCPVTGGSGTTATYSPGVTLNFDLPTTQGYAKGLLIKYNLQITPATPTGGSGTPYQLTQAERWAIFNRLELDYGGVQITTHPYFLKEIDAVMGRLTLPQNAILAGNQDSSISAVIEGTTPLVVNAANTWQGYMYLRFNPISKESPFGLLPLNGVGNQPQLKLTCAPNLFGPDPLFNAICSGGSGTGTNKSVAVTGTVQVDAVILDGRNMEGIAPKVLGGLLGMPTMQYYWEQSLTPFNAGLQNPFTIKTKLEHWMVMAIIIDGQQSTNFISGMSNITSFGLSPDATLQQYLINIGVSNNIPIWDWFGQLQRNELKQDLDEGVIFWVNAPGRGIVNSSNRNGSQYLNCYSDGYPAATHVYQVGATGTVCTPRIELFLVSKNRAGLKVT